VLVFVPYMPAPGTYDEQSAARLQRNLLYVSMTRAMDNLNIFTLNQPREPVLADLVKLMGA
jgi:ATP-dependent exoDNAse (exonuclease V) beta subunit